MKSKKMLALVMALLLVFSLALTACSKPATQGGGQTTQGTTPKPSSKQLNIGTASMGGAYYPFGQELSNLVQKYAGISMTPEVTGGGAENPRLVDQGDIDVGIAGNANAYEALNGIASYTKKAQISAIGTLYPSILHIIVLADSPIKSIADFKGKKIAVGPAGGGTLPMLEAALAEYGLTTKDIVPSYLAYADGFTQLADGNVDVALALSGYPTSSVMEIASSKKIRFISVEADKMANITKKQPYYSAYKVPKDSYKLESEATAIALYNVLLVRNDMDNDTVYNITKAIFGHLDELKQNNANAKDMSIAAAKQTVVPMHPGAKKFFDEQK